MITHAQGRAADHERAPQHQQPMIHPTVGATALQAQPARQPILEG